MVKTLFLGPEGTYSHQAALQQFGSHDDVEYIATESIPECMEKLETDKSIDYSVIPLENSTNGQVVFSYDLLRDRMVQETGMTSQGNRVVPTLQVIGEQYVSIVHCLIGTQPMKLESLKNYRKVIIHSHPQVWGQVSKYLAQLKQKFPQTTFEKIDGSSTSEAVRDAIESQRTVEPQVLNIAIASEMAARSNHCQVLESSINDKTGNTTRFLILERRNDASKCTDQEQISLMTFTTKLDDPGSLVDVLNILKRHSVNMCSINSRPLNSGTQKWQYVFFIEYYYNEHHDWASFYTEISLMCSYWCLWGIFPRNKRYYE